jgi:flagellar hook-associated protein 1 FlgK
MKSKRRNASTTGSSAGRSPWAARAAASTVSAQFFDQTRLDQLNQLESAFPTGTDGVGYAANQFLNAMSDVANNPQDNSARQVVLTRAQDLASRFAAASMSAAVGKIVLSTAPMAKG